ncbi:MAG: TIGR03905 family TSCPD domain-containing protein [Mogibacterium sp.]|nr:TIGR03905 family TSCPD domain-containing protein [Mogibacterium sp.]
MSRKFTFYPEGVCSMMIEIELSDDDTIKDVVFTGGCNGNLSGITKLIKDMKAEDVIERLEGTTCGFKDTSCPDQLSKALRQALQA